MGYTITGTAITTGIVDKVDEGQSPVALQVPIAEQLEGDERHDKI